MKNDQIILPLDYYEHLRKINGVEFTSREVDVISCLLNRRATSISAFLLIGQRAVETYNRNIRQKAGGLAGREQIIDFIEKSGKFSLIKNEYYFSLRLRVLFEEKLNAIAKKIDVKSSACLLVYEKGQKYQPSLLAYLKEHLKRVGFEVKTHLSEGDTFFTHPNEIINFEKINQVLYILPENRDKSLITQINMNHLSNVIFLLHQGPLGEDVYKKLNYINILEQENYYFSFFEILKQLLPHSDFESIVEDFKEQYTPTNRSSEIKIPQEDLNVAKELPSQTKKGGVISRRGSYLLIGFIAVVSVFSMGLFIFKRANGEEPFPIHFTAKQIEPLIRSDLILPNEKTLLNRPELMEQINSMFKGQGDIQAIAFVGIGGSGKTTTARHFAHQQKTNVVWEINAETNTSLIESFENLAQSLSKTEEDKKIIRELQEIKNSVERGKKLLEFVKERLRSHSNWFLIYDNVEDFADIQPYFPTDINTWGEGKVILTTRNHNIQNNRQVDEIVLVGELSSNQKLHLFLQIMNYGENKKLTVFQKEELMGFLEKIPSFPLDVSVAAYYLKTTNISYAKYLESLAQQDTNFTAVQENLLKEAGEYRNTRYGIITLALNQLISTHKDFGDLLLFISLLDSQNIPKELLDAYKEKTVVDNFIYHLKKYSLIATEPSASELGSTLSIHRSTQAITLSYLMQRLDLEKNTERFKKIIFTIEKNIHREIDEENFIKTKNLAVHLNALFGRKSLLTSPLKGIIKGSLGRAHLYLGDYTKARKFLEDSTNILSKDRSHNSLQFSRYLTALGNVEQHLGNYEKSKSLLNKSLNILRLQLPKNHIEIAQALTYLGEVHRFLGEHKNARKLLECSLQIYTSHLPEDHLKIACTLAYLGDVYNILGDYKKAKDLFEKSLTIYTKHFFKDHIAVAGVLVHLGVTYTSLGEYKKVKSLFNQSIKTYRKHFPENHLTIAWVLAHLGSFHSELGEYKKAKDLLESSLAIHKKHFSENHIRMTWVQVYLANVYYELGDYEKCKILIEQSLKTYKENFGDNHIGTAWISIFLGGIYKIQGEYEQAKSLLKKSLLIYESYYGKDHIEIAKILESLGKLYILEGDLRNAGSSLSHALAIYQSKGHPAEYKCLENFSDFHQKKTMEAIHKGLMEEAQKSQAQALNDLRQALKIVKTHFPEGTPHITRIQKKIKGLE